MGLKGWARWKKVYLPAVFPSWVAGAVTASGGAWNASIVCEYVRWGDKTLQAHGIGAYIHQMDAAGLQPKVLFGAAVMCVFVVTTNRLLWQRLSNLAESRYGIA
jgi:NitT/TauT family transport system permease protein